MPLRHLSVMLQIKVANEDYPSLDPDDTIITTPHMANLPMRTPTHSFGYWTDLLSNGNGYAQMPATMGVPDESGQYQQHGMPQQQHGMPQHIVPQYQHPDHYTTSRAPDPPIGPDMQQDGMNAAAQKRRWSMRTTSSGRTVVPARDSMRDSMRDSVRDSMRDSMQSSMQNSMHNVIRDSTMSANSNTDSRPGSMMSSVFHFGGS